ncbi:MAG: YceI family protein [Bacteroidota bacterium]
MLKKRNLWLPLLCLATTAWGQTRYVADTEASTIYWEGNMVLGGGHEGTVKLLSGVLLVSPEGLASEGEFTIDMRTITSTDMGEDGGGLDNHLKDEDFFYVIIFPYANFSMTSWGGKLKENSSETILLRGNLTVRGQTHPIEFPVVLTHSQEQLTATAELELDRTQYGITYKADNIFDSVKDGIIENTIPLKLNLVFHAQ